MLVQVFEEEENLELSDENLYLLLKRCDSDGNGIVHLNVFYIVAVGYPNEKGSTLSQSFGP